jgi:hypothetical protein
VSLQEIDAYARERTSSLTQQAQHPVIDRENPSLSLEFTAP